MGWDFFVRETSFDTGPLPAPTSLRHSWAQRDNVEPQRTNAPGKRAQETAPPARPPRRELLSVGTAWYASTDRRQTVCLPHTRRVLAALNPTTAGLCSRRDEATLPRAQRPFASPFGRAPARFASERQGDNLATAPGSPLLTLALLPVLPYNTNRRPQASLPNGNRRYCNAWPIFEESR